MNAPPYSVLAEIYDRIMRYVDYRRWAEFIREMLAAYGVAPNEKKRPTILDAACGTGSFALHLSSLGFSLTGFDSSPQMIAKAREKAASMWADITFEVGDFLTYQPNQAYDAVVSLFDSVNYLPPEDLPRFFRRVRSWVGESGLFLFDISTPYNSLLYFNNKNIEERLEDWHYRRYMIYYSQQHIQINRFELLSLVDRSRYIEEHLQYIYPVEFYRERLADCGWKILEEAEDFHRRPPSPNALRVHFLCVCNH